MLALGGAVVLVVSVGAVALPVAQLLLGDARQRAVTSDRRRVDAGGGSVGKDQRCWRTVSNITEGASDPLNVYIFFNRALS